MGILDGLKKMGVEIPTSSTRTSNEVVNLFQELKALEGRKLQPGESAANIYQNVIERWGHHLCVTGVFTEVPKVEVFFSNDYGVSVKFRPLNTVGTFVVSILEACFNADAPVQKMRFINNAPPVKDAAAKAYVDKVNKGSDVSLEKLRDRVNNFELE